MFLNGRVSSEQATTSINSIKNVLDKVSKEKLTRAEQKASELGVSLETAITYTTEEILNLKIKGYL